MLPERPDLSGLPEELISYIEALEAALENDGNRSAGRSERSFTEPETTVQLISWGGNLIKKTSRHHYSRQNRGGMGVYDIVLPDSGRPSLLAVADQAQRLLCFTNHGRAFYLAVEKVTTGDMRSDGFPLEVGFPLRENEHVVVSVPENEGAFLVLLSERGWVRRIRRTHFNELIPGFPFHKLSEGGEIVAGCWTNGEQDIFIGTEAGLGIRFAEKQIGTSARLGIRLAVGDKAIGIAATSDEGNLLLVGHDGKGTVRAMSGFRQNKTPGAGGKVALKTERLVVVGSVNETDDICLIAESSKLIRFAAADIPVKEGVVQGVNCMNVRSEAIVAGVVLPLSNEVIV